MFKVVECNEEFMLAVFKSVDERCFADETIMSEEAVKTFSTN